MDLIKKTLKDCEIEPSWLEIEITEGAIMKSIEENIELLTSISEVGVKISVDDFGTGYSSLNYLRLLPIDTLKIDKAFIDNIDETQKDKAIIDGLIQLAHSIDYKVVAEGVETQQQFDILSEYNCELIQGYFFSRPLPAYEIELLLQKN